MFKFALAMVIPLMILIYTLSFGRWLHHRKVGIAEVSAYALAIISFGTSGVVFWQLFS
jgi:hypothetical protein